jgi:hypothetical protein
LKFFALNIFQKNNVDISQITICLNWPRPGLIKNANQWMECFLPSLGVELSDTFKFMNGHATDLRQRYASQSLLLKRPDKISKNGI